MNLATLKTELTTDPLGRGYKALDDDAIARTFATADRSVNRDSIDGGLLASCLVRSEYNALSANDQNYVRLLCGTATAIPLTSAFKTELGGVFGAGTTTRANLIAAVKRSGNRAEELNLGGIPTASDIADAKRS